MVWVRFLKHYDHRWPEGAKTAFNKGMVTNVKKEVADEAVELGVAEVTTKPKDGHEPGEDRASAVTKAEGLRYTGPEIITGGSALAETRNVLSLPDAADPEAEREEPLTEEEMSERQSAAEADGD